MHRIFRQAIDQSLRFSLLQTLKERVESLASWFLFHSSRQIQKKGSESTKRKRREKKGREEKKGTKCENLKDGSLLVSTVVFREREERSNARKFFKGCLDESWRRT